MKNWEWEREGARENGKKDFQQFEWQTIERKRNIKTQLCVPVWMNLQEQVLNTDCRKTLNNSNEQRKRMNAVEISKHTFERAFSVAAPPHKTMEPKIEAHAHYTWLGFWFFAFQVAPLRAIAPLPASFSPHPPISLSPLLTCLLEYIPSFPTFLSVFLMFYSSPFLHFGYFFDLRHNIFSSVFLIFHLFVYSFYLREGILSVAQCCCSIFWRVKYKMPSQRRSMRLALDSWVVLFTLLPLDVGCWEWALIALLFRL